MPLWVTLFLSFGGSTLIALIVTLIFNKLKDGTKRAIDKRNESTRQEMRSIIQEENEDIKNKLNNLEDKIDTIQNGSQCSLRTQILNSYYECQAKKYKTTEEAENMERLINAYYKLGGNSFVQHTIEPEFRNIPTMSKSEAEEQKRLARQKSKKQVLMEDYDD